MESRSCRPLLLAFLAMIVLVSAGCGPKAAAWPDASLPPEVVHDEDSLAVYDGKAFHVTTTMLVDQHGQQRWRVSLAYDPEASAVVYASRKGDSWSALRIIPSPLPPTITIDGPVATLDASGWPVVVWLGREKDSYSKATVFCARWTGSGFAVRELLTEAHGKPAICTDSQGNVHLVYHDELSPSEGYSVGLDGVFPLKFFHRIFRNGQWSEARPTSSRGRYDVRDGRLTAGPDGSVWLTAVIRTYGYFHRGQPYTASQKWNGTRWSGWKRVKPRKGR